MRDAKTEELYLDRAEGRLDKMAAEEQISAATFTGIKRPHLMLISSKWHVPADADTYEMSPETMFAFKAAVKETAPDGNPIICIPYHWNINPTELIAQIKSAIAACTGYPQDATVRALSLGLMVHHSHGSVFVTKHQLS